MKRERILVENRRNEILEELKQHGEIEVNQLAAKWNISPLTIRRDLQFLEDQKKIVRFYGGAALAVPQAPEEDDITLYRRLIAQYAASLVEDRDSIFVNTSITALQMVKYLGGKQVTVITNNGQIINMEVPPSVSAVLTGGEVRYPKHAMVGEFALRNLEHVSVKKCFMGCSGLSVERGMTTEIMNEVNINRLMIQGAIGTTYILADHRKLGKNSSFVSCSVNHITHIITDERADENVVSAFREKGIHVYQVSKKDAD